MGSEIESGLEEKLTSLLEQLQAECGIFERIVYKNKNQHRRCSYFQYLLKVRRDLRLLQSAKLEEIVGSCFQVITGRKPKQKMYLLESLKWRQTDSGVPNFLERLLGAARILSQMVEPILKAATEVSILLARSFFMEFCLAVLALLARLRVLVQQILLDVVSLSNTVSSIAQNKQSVKVNQKGIEVFREYYPTNKEFTTLECVWKVDKFVLLERVQKTEVKEDEETIKDANNERKAIRYRSIKAFLREINDDDDDVEKMEVEHPVKEDPSLVKKDEGLTAGSPIPKESEHQEQRDGIEMEDDFRASPGKGGDVNATSSSSPAAETSTSNSSSSRQVAFVSVKRPAAPPTSAAGAFIAVKRPATSTSNVTTPTHSRDSGKEADGKEDSLFNLLTDGANLKNSLF
ncbi:unnamed protein product [Linum trigynum]|uniref:Nucleolus and neural progenitor protein-like N-terminal domain-containing protein n=1 Tax=Linum trigynum TaxID=586398 RepID=A0AAV2EFW7_9ROSI